MIFELEYDHLIESGVPLDIDDLRLGVSRGYIAPRTAIAVATAAVSAGSDDVTVNALARMSDHHVADVRDALGAVDPQDALLEPATSARKWLYFQLRAAHALRSRLDDPLGAVESIYADFGYPPTAAPFVRYMPAQPGEQPGVGQLFARWANYLQREQVALTTESGRALRAWFVIESDEFDVAWISAHMKRDSVLTPPAASMSWTDESRASASWAIELRWPEEMHPGGEGLDLALAGLGWSFAERAGALAARGCRTELRMQQELSRNPWTTGMGLSRGAVEWLRVAGASLALAQQVEAVSIADQDEDPRGGVLGASIIIRSDAETLAHITQTVGQEPDKGYERGSVRSPGRHARTTTSWCLDVHLPAHSRPGAEGLSRAVEALDDALAAGAAQLAHKDAVVSLDLYQDLSDDRHSHGVYLSSRAIRWLANAGAEIDIDQYVHGHVIHGVLEEIDLAHARIVTPEQLDLEMAAERKRNEERWAR